ncbi:NAD(P)H-hydrate dehydratase [Thermofilum pendens]|uniref:Bifunctional NAD(P)H-hydrate repair enzyme Nnr n=1 Tax=Thermofilum pendens (strain DSM 2475 / Hrk 5) TaxID=368408 RepID=NNR_THEPD|nr:NAD(P)H-hydrate dehydratase [Thermofilum pendens]A1S0R2.1 RecName: Full=Bifunctional NAD(P)H-hydrate repair enzyme Nnr; AltName: Full=Nicotinamide nucleotide repair protein; Includes: RecName: Full=ADP-dependent (S)-NAD(P)H-hydrate dehydratase; AltName: Full=ADP-dependent NAD(P)HX dehydratase; Includes: RecName: Full=NAD(P)H-hydrate epimerase; AltName: Full=NAD(P)HX epimerase [Thermofilum pendens Hrk 5]ABL79042.1 carbohydrate kinase, YjeF related protein [Thermofilum pendens Hrk 5]
MKVARVSEIKLLDREAAEKYGVKEEILMENAGASVARLAVSLIGLPMSAAVVCGPGNNGGDGLVAARHLSSMGADVKVFLVAAPDKLAGIVKENYERVVKAGIAVEVVDEERAEGLSEELSLFDVVVDALFGTGLSRPLEGVYRKVVEAINGSGSLVISVDIPSGVHGDTGQVLGVAVRADYTVTFGLPKLGNLMYPGAELGGELYVHHISYPRALLEDSRLKVETNDPVPLPPRRPDTHKGDYGKALFVAGSRRYMGAPLLCSKSFLKAGGGYSRLATIKSIVPFLGVRAPEVVYEALEETASGTVAYGNLERILELSKSSDIVAVGPGLGLEEETLRLVCDLARSVEKPLIVDGDGLTAVARCGEYISERRAPTVLTPHAGEMSRLTGKSVEEVRASRVDAALELAGKLKAYVVLKGAHTVIATPDGRAYINLSGNPGMATAGSGDVLVGAIAALYGLGLGFEEAVRMGVFVHGLAGDIAAEERGQDGLTSVTLMNYLPKALRALREDFESVLERYTIKVLP